MAISALFPDFTTTSGRSPSCTLTGYTPQLGDTVLLCPKSDSVTAVTDSAGWTNLLGANAVVQSDGHSASVLRHDVTSADVLAGTTTYTATNFWNSSITGRAIGFALRGADLTNLVDDIVATFDSANTANPHIMPGLSGANLSTGSTVISMVVSDNAQTGTYPATITGYTTILVSGSGVTPFGVYMRDALTVAGVSVAAVNVTPPAGDEYIGISMALVAAPPTTSLPAPVRRPNYGSLIQT